MTVAILPMGDAAFTLQVDDAGGAAGARRMNQLCAGLLAARGEDDALAGVVDLIPATQSLTVCFDPEATDFEALSAHIVDAAQTMTARADAAPREWRLPACYDAEHGLDLADVASETGLSVDEVVALHSGQTYDVLLIGFLPGFPYLGGLDDQLRLPRLATPRMRVPPGSVAIANDTAAIYPWASPGGWRLLARCPVPLFDAEGDPPSLLRPGDRVRFAPVDGAELRRIEDGLATGALTPASFRSDDAAS